MTSSLACRDGEDVTYYQSAGNLQKFLQMGATIPNIAEYQKNGLIGMNLSPEISRETALTLCREIPKQIMSAKDYYDIKAHSYFEIGYNYKDFLDDLQKCNPEKLPFRL